MLKIILIAIVVVIAAVLIYAATKPDTFSVQRSATIKAPPEKIFALVNDFNQWPKWSPWEEKDPTMQRTHSGAPAGKGAVYEWNGNKDVGQGRMEIIQSSPPSQISIKLDFLKPFEAHNIADFSFTPDGDATVVKWVMHGPNPYLGKLMQVFMDIDRMVGTDFEAGLAKLKTAAETP
jgi:uncharacterized protein YndB with AHSA1/START domain